MSMDDYDRMREKREEDENTKTTTTACTIEDEE